MRFYRVHVRSEGGLSAGYLWFTSHKDAWKAKRQHDAQADVELDHADDPESVQIEPTRDGILSALREWASHADNG